MSHGSSAERNLRRDAILEAVNNHALEEARNYLCGAISLLEGVYDGELNAATTIPSVFSMLARALVFSEAV